MRGGSNRDDLGMSAKLVVRSHDGPLFLRQDGRAIQARDVQVDFSPALGWALLPPRRVHQNSSPVLYFSAGDKFHLLDFTFPNIDFAQDALPPTLK